jgi:hypothetical protein
MGPGGWVRSQAGAPEASRARGWRDGEVTGAARARRSREAASSGSGGDLRFMIYKFMI